MYKAIAAIEDEGGKARVAVLVDRMKVVARTSKAAAIAYSFAVQALGFG